MLVDGQPVREEAKNGLSVLLACTPACQHPSCWHAAMLGCTPAAQTDQHTSTQHVSVHQHAEVACLSVGACVYPSTQHPAPFHFGYTRGCWPCGHVPGSGSDPTEERRPRVSEVRVALPWIQGHLLQKSKHHNNGRPIELIKARTSIVLKTEPGKDGKSFGCSSQCRNQKLGRC